jgi:hypothetical protein
MSGPREGFATAVVAIGKGEAPVAGEVGEQLDLLEIEEAETPLPMPPAKVATGKGRPPGARNRRTEEWVRYLLSRYRSPLVGLLEIYSRSAQELAEQLHVERGEAARMQLQAMIAALPYLHQRLPLAVDVKSDSRGLLVVGEIGAGTVVGGLTLPLAEGEENQEVRESAREKSDVGASDEWTNPLMLDRK